MTKEYVEELTIDETRPDFDKCILGQFNNTIGTVKKFSDMQVLRD